MKAILVNCTRPGDVAAVMQHLDPQDESLHSLHVAELKDAVGPIMDESFDLMLVCAEALSRQEKNMLGYLSATYPGLKIIVKLGNTDQKQVFVNKGMMQSDPEVLKKITEV